tara:strand:- start:3951 stop:4850 length:900 start_codon:yes stop_codon:yes gene_type:complete
MKSLLKIVNKMSRIEQLCLALLIILIISQIRLPQQESFSIQNKKYVLLDNRSLYDSFYASVYDNLLFEPNKNAFEISEILHFTDIKNKHMLDIGSGTGHHCDQFTRQEFKCIGLDKSLAMIDKAKENYPQLNFMQGDANHSILYNPEQFGLITILYFTIYYMKDKKTVFKNCYDWLDNNGYLVIHLVNKEHFDPIVPAANPLLMVNVQDYAKKRITKSKIVFDKFEYQSKFIKDEPSGFHEKFIFKDGKIRENHHQLYFETQKKILGYLKQLGFIMKGKINMYNCGYENQYLYILQKPK